MGLGELDEGIGIPDAILVKCGDGPKSFAFKFIMNDRKFMDKMTATNSPRMNNAKYSVAFLRAVIVRDPVDLALDIGAHMGWNSPPPSVRKNTSKLTRSRKKNTARIWLNWVGSHVKMLRNDVDSCRPWHSRNPRIFSSVPLPLEPSTMVVRLCHCSSILSPPPHPPPPSPVFILGCT